MNAYLIARFVRRGLTIVATLACVALMSACGTSHRGGVGALTAGNSLGTPAASATPAASPGVDASASPTATPGRSTPTTHPAAPATHAYPDDYPAAIIAAASSRDSAYLSLLMSTSSANSLLHDISGRDQHWTRVHDDAGAGSRYTAYGNRTGDQLILQTSSAEVSARHWHAAELRTWDPTVYPSTALAYAKAYVNAWIDGNDVRMRVLGTNALADHFLAMTAPDSSYTATVSATYSDSVTVEITASGLDISLIVMTASLRHSHAIQGCDIGC